MTPLHPSQKWPRIGRKIPLETLEDVTKQIFRYSLRGWQTKVVEKMLEGHDAIVIAGTGAGKSLVFVMLAIVAELAGFKGVVIVICPLKSLQKDQVCFFKIWSNGGYLTSSHFFLILGEAAHQDRASNATTKRSALKTISCCCQ